MMAYYGNMMNRRMNGDICGIRGDWCYSFIIYNDDNEFNEEPKTSE